MHSLRLGVEIAWIVFWVGWLASAFTAKRSTGLGRGFGSRGLAAVAVFLLIRVFHGGSLDVHSVVLGTIGTVLFVAGVGVATWARLILGRNWGMPMTEKLEPELVTAGPYRLVRHPIYAGLLLAVLGTSLVTDVIGIGITVVLGAFFVYAATVEERNLTATFPQTYPAYRSRTKMLIPYLL